MHYVKGGLAVLLLLAVVVFAIQNRDPVPLRFLVWSMSVPEVFLILGTYVLGILSGWGLIELIRRAF